LVAKPDPELVAIPTTFHCGSGGIPSRLSTNNTLILLYSLPDTFIILMTNTGKSLYSLPIFAKSSTFFFSKSSLVPMCFSLLPPYTITRGKAVLPNLASPSNSAANANNDVDIQEFMIIPSNKFSFKEGLMRSVEVYMNLKKHLSENGHSISVGDEGGFAPNLGKSEEVIETIISAIESIGFKYKDDISIALDCAASELFKDNLYHLKGENKILQRNEMVDYITELAKKYEINSIEDPFDETDWNSWKEFTKENNSIQIVGDDIFVTQTDILKKGIDECAANSILIKLNQVGTLTETMQTIALAKENNFGTVISHRSGETEDTFIADLAVAVDAKQIKTGAPARSDRTAKYNRLLMIEDELYP